MALIINGISPGKDGKPHDLGQVQASSNKYLLGPFVKTLSFKITDSASGKSRDLTVDVKAKIDQAWQFVTNRAAKCEACNTYFKSLPGKKTLEDILNGGNIVLHCLKPRKGFTEADLPRGVSVGRHIGIDPSLLAEKGYATVAATLIHELAHVGGAPANAYDDKSNAAETALKHCLLPKHFDPNALGVIQRMSIGGQGGFRVV